MPFKPTLIAAALTLTMAQGAARADVVSEGDGNLQAVPLYRVFAFGGIDRDAATDSGYAAQDIFGIDYKSNVVPRGVANIIGTVCDDGLQLSGAGCAGGSTEFRGLGQTVYSGMGVGRNYAQMTVTNAKATDAYYLVAGVGEAKKVQFFVPGAQVSGGYATFTWRVTGTHTNPLFSSGAVVTGRMDFGASLDPATNWLQLFNDPDSMLNSITNFGPGTYTYDLPIANLGEPVFLYNWSSAFVSVGAGQAQAGSSFTLTADYTHTVLLESVALFDESQTPLPQWTLAASDSGENLFDQTGRLAPIDPPPALVPEPGTWAMLLAGLAILGGIRLRRCRQ
jgi:hypothetical protein